MCLLLQCHFFLKIIQNRTIETDIDLKGYKLYLISVRESMRMCTFLSINFQMRFCPVLWRNSRLILWVEPTVCSTLRRRVNIKSSVRLLASVWDFCRFLSSSWRVGCCGTARSLHFFYLINFLCFIIHLFLMMDDKNILSPVPRLQKSTVSWFLLNLSLTKNKLWRFDDF